MAFNVQIATAALGNVNGAGPFPLWYLPDEGGAISVLAAHAVSDGAGTSVGLKLISITDAGTPSSASGTIGSFAGTVTYAANARYACTLATPAVSDGQWIGVEQTSGTVAANTRIVLSYVMGK